LVINFFSLPKKNIQNSFIIHWSARDMFSPRKIVILNMASAV
jgi:hypothetical protein